MHHRRAPAPLLVVLAALVTSAACTRSGKVELDASYLAEHGVYRSDAFAREPYLVEALATGARIACRTWSPDPPALKLAPYHPEATQRWASSEVRLTALERRRLADAGRLGPGPLFQHVASLDGLHVRTPYHVLLTAGTQTRDVHLRTAPERGEGEVAFLVLGDSGTGSEQQLALARALAASIHHPRGAAHAIDFIVHTGDLVYDHGHRADYEAVVFAPYRELLARAPLYGVLGNHDVRAAGAAPLFEAFPIATAERPYWHRVVGPLELIGGDTTMPADYHFTGGIKPGGDDVRRTASGQRSWLSAVFQQPRAPWRFLVIHHPVLSSGNRHGSGRLLAELEMRELRAALRAAFGRVSFVLQGHDHHYERSVPIAAAWVEGDGALEVPAAAEGRHEGVDRRAMRRREALADRTVCVVQGAGGGLLADTVATRLGWGATWLLGLPLGSPLWLSYGPVGFDAVDAGEPWVERAEIVNAVTRFDVSAEQARLRTWRLCKGELVLVDDVTYTR